MLHFDDELAKSCGQLRPMVLHVKHQNHRTLSKYVITKPYAIVGRNSSCDICLDHEDVSKQHAYLQVLDGKLFCVDQGSRHGIFWKETPQLYGWMNPGQCIEIGPYELSLEQHLGIDLPAKSLRNTAPFFARYSPKHPANAMIEINGNRQFSLKHQLALIGRCKHCNIILDTEEISPIHASIVRTLDGKCWLVVPIGIKVRVNGTRCISTELHDEDVITVGNHTLTFKLLADSPETGPIKKGSSEEAIQLRSPQHAIPSSSLIEIDIDTQLALQRASERAGESEFSTLQLLSQSNPSGIPMPTPENSTSTRSLVKRQQSQPVVARLAGTTQSLANKQTTALSTQGTQDVQLVDVLVQHMQQMQQEMMTQMRMNMEMMAKFMVNLQKQHMEMVREEMNHLNKINQELLHLRQSLVTVQPAKVESYRLSINPSPEKAKQTELPEPPAPAVPSKQENSERKSAVKPEVQNTHAPPDEPASTCSHSWITQRIAVLEKERTSRWEKMKSAFLGK